MACDSSPDRWRLWDRIDPVLENALELPPGQRGQYVDRECAQDPVLKRHVETLLLADRGTRLLPGAPLRGPLLESWVAQAPADPPPPLVGRYRILQELGRGGMSEVYLAERADGEYHQLVALKRLRGELAGADAERRFQTERQILAGLEHPGIARLLDGGLDDQGRPYLVMERIEGEPLDRYCDRRRLSVRERLRLFLAVAAAVDHAHRNLVVHRDLKPANIQVTAEGAVKLIDFGIAKLLQPDSLATDSLPATAAGEGWRTPHYSAPEQIRGEPVTTATDVFQLGVVLYELLTGELPFDDARGSRFEIERAVLEHEPVPPSRRVARAGSRSDGAEGEPPNREVASRRSTTPARLARALGGDLDAVLLKALRKEPERRYASALSVARDLERHLQRQPVLARGGSLRYRAGRFVRRHVRGVAFAAAFLLLLMASTLLLAHQARRVARERDRAEQTAAFVTDMLAELGPAQIGGPRVEARTILDRAAAQVSSALAGRPLIQAKLYDAIGHAYQYHGHFAESERLLELALGLREDTLGPAHLDVAESRHHLAVLRYRISNYETEDLLRSAIEVYRRELGPQHPRVYEAMTELAQARRARGEYAGAVAAFREVLANPSQQLVANGARATALHFLGKLLTTRGELEEAERLLDEALALRRAAFGSSHPVVANTLEAVGLLELERGRPGSAARIFADVVEMRRSFFSEGHTDLGYGYLNQALALRALGDDQLAEALLLTTLESYRKVFGKESTDVARVLHLLGEIAISRRDLDAASQLLEQAHANWRAQPLAAGHLARADLLETLGRLRLEQGRLDEAAPLLGESLGLRHQALPADHPSVRSLTALLEEHRVTARLDR